jgi:hypothetical protein
MNLSERVEETQQNVYKYNKLWIKEKKILRDLHSQLQEEERQNRNIGILSEKDFKKLKNDELIMYGTQKDIEYFVKNKPELKVAHFRTYFDIKSEDKFFDCNDLTIEYIEKQIEKQIHIELEQKFGVRIASIRIGVFTFDIEKAPNRKFTTDFTSRFKFGYSIVFMNE